VFGVGAQRSRVTARLNANNKSSKPPAGGTYSRYPAL
jgi:hypothetical protein